MAVAIKETNFNFEGQTDFYRGKVRDVYFFGDKIAMIASDRVSAFDVVLPRAIPYKGQILNQLAAKNLKATEDILPNWLIATPEPNVSVGVKCEPFPIEMVIRGYLTGHAWRTYKEGKRELCGVSLPDGLKENKKLPQPIITPTTKASKGHDEDISKDEIIEQGLATASNYAALEQYTYMLFERGTCLAAKQGLTLVDTKYEFGKFNDKIHLIDEVHTPDSSRYFYANNYPERNDQSTEPRQLSKEFVRQWLINNGFQGQKGQSIPEMSDEVVKSISDRYIELYEKFTGEKFIPQLRASDQKSIQQNIFRFVNRQ